MSRFTLKIVVVEHTSISIYRWFMEYRYIKHKDSKSFNENSNVLLCQIIIKYGVIQKQTLNLFFKHINTLT